MQRGAAGGYADYDAHIVEVSVEAQTKHSYRQQQQRENR